MKKFTHFLYVPFTGLGLHNGYRGDKWLANRIRVFKQFVLPSIQNHTVSSKLWISWRKQEKNNPQVISLLRTLKNIRGIEPIFTYGGVCFWDDKYKHDNLKERLEVTLPNLTKYVNKTDYVLMTIQPSDDMYLLDSVENMRNKLLTTNYQVAGYRKGYMMNYATKEVAEYNPDTIPPFFTVKFKTKTFITPEEHFAYCNYKSHENIKDNLAYTKIDGRGFVVGTHGENISTVWEHPYKGKLVDKEQVMIKTNTYFSDPVIVRRGIRLVARRVLNALPFNNKLRKLYHKLPIKPL